MRETNELVRSSRLETTRRPFSMSSKKLPSLSLFLTQLLSKLSEEKGGSRGRVGSEAAAACQLTDRKTSDKISHLQLRPSLINYPRRDFTLSVLFFSVVVSFLVPTTSVGQFN